MTLTFLQMMSTLRKAAPHDSAEQVLGKPVFCQSLLFTEKPL